VPLDAAARTVGGLVLDERREEARAGQLSLSDCAASFGQMALTPDRRSSESRSSTRAVSMVLGVRVMPTDFHREQPSTRKELHRWTSTKP
jgi:hypothetical protein